MKFIAVFALPALVAAQYGYVPPSGPSTPTTAVTAPVVVPSAPADTAGNMNINVGFNGGFVYNPANITAPVGTLVTFWFPSGIPHSVTQSTFANPCTYLAASGSSPGGFDSGLQTAVTFTINVTDTNPIWFHCKQVSHCGLGMVGSINAPATGNTYDLFQAAAMKLTNAPTETDNGPVTGGVDGIATATPVADTSTTTSAPSSSGAGQTVVSFGFLTLSALVVFIAL